MHETPDMEEWVWPQRYTEPEEEVVEVVKLDKCPYDVQIFSIGTDIGKFASRKVAIAPGAFMVMSTDSGHAEPYWVGQVKFELSLDFITVCNNEIIYLQVFSVEATGTFVLTWWSPPDDKILEQRKINFATYHECRFKESTKDFDYAGPCRGLFTASTKRKRDEEKTPQIGKKQVPNRINLPLSCLPYVVYRVFPNLNVTGVIPMDVLQLCNARSDVLIYDRPRYNVDTG
jgi:hypothetical protein